MTQEKEVQPVAAEPDTESPKLGADGTSGAQEKSTKQDNQEVPPENVTSTGISNEATTDENAVAGGPEDTRVYIKGWRKHILTVG
jgi:hypothetical protein